ncbi:MAG: DNA translocase FtsK 4TM domain-containing protein [Bacteroidales bacterium]|nr:DNA translocase FtsK 4TM domain-containing protein [Bacteroidales bacterium]
MQIYGVLLMAFAILLLVSLFSYFFHHETDVSHVVSHTSPENVAGTVGAHLAYIFVDGCMGIFSVGFAFLLFLYGIRLTFSKAILPLFRTTVATLLTMAWLSITLGVFVYQSDQEFLAGSFGTFLSQLVITATGKLVAILILIAFLLIIMILCYGFSMNSLLKLRIPKHGKSSDDAEDEEVDNHQKKGRRWFGRKDKEDDEVQFEPQTDDTKLSDLYITNKNELSDEYRGKVYHFETNEGEAKLENEKETKPENEDDGFDFLTSQKKEAKKYEEVPFEVKIGGGDKSADELFPDVEDSLEPADNEGDNQENTESTEAEIPAEPLEDYDPRKDLSFYQFPTLDLLNDYPAKEANEEQMRKELTEKKVRIEQTLNNFGISIKNITATVGPTVTLYEIVPAEGVRISKIKNLEDDIALSLAALGIRIIAPIPGRGTIGIEVPNKSPNIVSMKDVLASDKFKNNKYELPIALGKTISDEPFVVDLAKMPHVLMAGATGQGKSVGLNAIITSLLYTKHPSELKFVLVDPKKVEFTLYSAIENHYLAKLPDVEEAIITDTKKVVRTLNSLCAEMDQRYDLLKIAKTRNIKEYNAKFCARKLSPALGHRYLPYIVLIIDEFGDLIMTAGREVEMPIARLAQLARAIGIHLVIATQRPSVNIITGIIKANFPARIAFRVTSIVDSRTILDGSGANQLIGKGDMLISTGSDLIRLQCAFVDTPEVERIVNFIEEQQAYPEPFLLPEVAEESSDDRGGDSDDFDSDEIDPLFMDAATLVVQTQQGSTSSIQRKMKLGYNRAGRIMDQLEEFGIVGPAERSGKPREVKVKTSEELRVILQRMGIL